MQSAIRWLAPSIKDIAPSYGYKPAPKRIPKNMFMEMLANYKVSRASIFSVRSWLGWSSYAYRHHATPYEQNLTEVFKRQAWLRQPEDFKIEVVAEAETRSALRFDVSALDERMRTAAGIVVSLLHIHGWDSTLMVVTRIPSPTAIGGEREVYDKKSKATV